MTRDELPIEKQKEYDSIVKACMKEIEEKVPKPQATFDNRPNLIRKQITDKYLPKLEQILLEHEKEQANKEWQELLSENAIRYEKRTKELMQQGIKFGLDGENLYQDINDWFDSELKKIKTKYNI